MTIKSQSPYNNVYPPLPERPPKTYTTTVGPAPTEEPKWRFSEGEILEEIKQHLASTYSADYHYTQKDEQLQAIDVWIASGTAATTCRDTAVKYLLRYGKKDGKNKKDLLKALHYIVWMLYLDHYKK